MTRSRKKSNSSAESQLKKGNNELSMVETRSLTQKKKNSKDAPTENGESENRSQNGDKFNKNWKNDTKANNSFHKKHKKKAWNNQIEDIKHSKQGDPYESSDHSDSDSNSYISKDRSNEDVTHSKQGLDKSVGKGRNLKDKRVWESMKKARNDVNEDTEHPTQGFPYESSDHSDYDANSYVNEDKSNKEVTHPNQGFDKSVGDSRNLKDKTVWKSISSALANFCLLIVVVAVVCFHLGIDFLPMNFLLQNKQTRLEQFRADFNKTKVGFPNQQKKLWKVVKIELEKNLKNEDNKAPAILMLASNRESYATTHCLAKKLSQTFSTQCENESGIKVDGLRLTTLDGDSAKLELDNLLETGFQNGACSATILRLESIPAFASTTFYQYCENDNAPFKDVAIIFTVQIDNDGWNVDGYDLDNLPANKWDLVVGEFLTKSLQSRDPARMTNEMVSALLSRITPSVVWVQNEESLRYC